MNQVELHYGAASDRGLVREHNEDAHLALPPVFVVADGMGGHDRGDVASRIVVDTFTDLAVSGYDRGAGPQAIAEALAASQEAIAAFDAEQRRLGAEDFQAGTTVVAAILIEEAERPKWLLANLGDSRVYRFHAGELEQISVDHSVVQEMIEAGVLTDHDAAVHPSRHVITRALGGAGSLEPDFFVLPLSGAERLLLCSDGVSGMISAERIATILDDCPDPRDAAETVVKAAVEAGGEDNATAVVVDVVGLAEDRPYDSAAQRLSLEQKLGALP